MSTTVSPYTPGSGDAAIEMLREVFGDAITHISGGSLTAAEAATANMLGTAFGFFNSGVLFFGTILLLWMTIFGVTNSANDGQVLGKKWSTFYTPMRTLTASAMLIPSTSGYSMVQMSILLIVTWSVGFASNMWGAVVDYVVNGQAIDQAVSSVQEDPNFDQMAYDALRMQVCAYAVNQGINQSMGTGTVNLQPVSVNDTAKSIGASNPNSSLWINPYISTTYTTTVMMRDPNWAGSENICGKMILSNTYIAPDTHSGAVQDVAASVRNAVNTVRFKYAMELLDPNGPIGNIAKQAIQVAESTNQTISASAINDQIVAIRAKMTSEITQTVKSQVTQDNAAISQQFKASGWVAAASLERELAQIKDAIRSVSTSRSEYVSGTSSIVGLIPSGDAALAAQTVMVKYNALIDALVQKANTGSTASTSGKPVLPSLQTSFTAGDFTSGGNSIKSMVTTYFNVLPDKLMQGLTTYLAEDGSDPVMQVKDVGDWMASFAEAIMVTKALVASSLDGVLEGLKVGANESILGTNIAAGGGILAGLVAATLRLATEFYAIAKPGIMTLLYGGYFLGMWIPMVPFYVFSLGVIGWLVQVVESLAAGSLWMVMHITPERDDSFIGSQQQGYLLLMSLFARPPLMILGMVASLVVLNPSVRYINEGFITSFRIIQTDSVTGILSIAGFMLIYCVIIFGVFMLVFSLPQTLPDRILRWVGAGISDLGEQGTMSRIEGSASSQARTAAVAGAAKQSGIDAARANAARDDVSRVQLAHEDAIGGGDDPVGPTRPM